MLTETNAGLTRWAFEGLFSGVFFGPLADIKLDGLAVSGHHALVLDAHLVEVPVDRALGNVGNAAVAEDGFFGFGQLERQTHFGSLGLRVGREHAQAAGGEVNGRPEVVDDQAATDSRMSAEFGGNHACVPLADDGVREMAPMSDL
jgi:hypothetical protein